MLHDDYENPSDSDPTSETASAQSSRSAADPAAAFLEARQVFKNFQVPGGTIRVDTRIKVSRSPWSVRSVVLENDTEIQEGPFAPIQQEFEATSADPEGLHDLRLDFARKALAGHLARCKQVERALSGKSSSSGKSKGAMIAVIVALVLAVGGATGYVFWTQHKAKTSGQAKKQPQTTPAMALTPTPVPAPAATETTPTAVAEATPIIIKVVPKPPIGLPPQTVKPAPGPAVRQPPQLTGKIVKPSLTDRQVKAPQAEPEAQPSVSTASESTLIREIQPSNYRIGLLKPGGDAYVDNLATFVEIPGEYRNLHCVKTANDDRTAKTALSFQLSKTAKVYVAHDSRIRKKPKWLQAFAPTGRHLSLLEKGEESEVATFDLFVREYPAGAVALGANTEWSSLTRVFRETIPKKIGMYVVCAQEER